MIQRWVLQGRVKATDREWFDLHEGRRIKDLPPVNEQIARAIGAVYRITLKSHHTEGKVTQWIDLP